MAGPLTGFKIIELSTGRAGPLAGMLFADNGAEVIRIVSPDPDHSLEAAGYPVWNRGKQEAVIDIRTSQGAAVLEGLLADADVLLETMAPGEMAKLGFGYEALHAKFPRLVYTSISGYGQKAAERDRPAYESLIHARTGIMDNEHYKPRPGPIYTGFPMGGYGAAMFALMGSATALLVRETTGRGQHVDTSLRDGALGYYSMFWNKVGRGQSGFASYSMKNRGPGIVDIFKCSNGFVHLHTGAQGAFPRLMAGMGMEKDYPELHNIPDPDWQRMLERTAAWFVAHTRDEGMAMLNKADVPALPVMEPGEAMHDPQSRAMKFSEIVHDPVLGELEQVGIALRFSKTPGAIQGPAPRHGEHTDAIIKRAAAASRSTATTKAGKTVQHPLEGIRVVDFGIMFAGPYAAKQLADLGATVIKVEAITGDPMRRSQSVFNGAQRNKRSLAVDLKTPEGLAIAHQLMAKADVVCHNMRPGTAEKLGIDYGTARKLNADVIYLHSPAFGNGGPRQFEPSFEPLVSAMVGIEMNCGGEGADKPGRIPANMDSGNGLLGAAGVIMALLHRQRTGEGQFVESPFLISGMLHTSETYFLPNGQLAPRRRLDKNVQGYDALDRVYETKAGWICIVVDTDARFQALGKALGAAQLATDTRFATRQARHDNDAALIAALDARFREQHAEHWFKVLDAAGVPCEIPITNGAGKLFNSPENLASGLAVSYTHPTFGELTEIGLGVRYSETPGVTRTAAPLIGQHSRELLAELGLDEAKMADLKARKVVTWPDAA